MNLRFPRRAMFWMKTHLWQQSWFVMIRKFKHFWQSSKRLLTRTTIRKRLKADTKGGKFLKLSGRRNCFHNVQKKGNKETKDQRSGRDILKCKYKCPTHSCSYIDFSLPKQNRKKTQHKHSLKESVDNSRHQWNMYIISLIQFQSTYIELYNYRFALVGRRQWRLSMSGF